MKEEFKEIEGFPFYYISNLGTVKSTKRGNEKFLKPCMDSYGYLYVGLRAGNGQKNKWIARLVAEAFIPNNDNSKIFVNHENGIKTDNNVNNLSWCTHSENINHAVRTGLKITKKGKDHPLTDLTIYHFFNANTLKSFVGIRQEFQKEHGIHSGEIAHLVNKHRKHLRGWKILLSIKQAA